VLLVPLHTPPHKSAGEDPGPEHRLRMCELTVDGSDGLGVCALEIERGGASYTVDTLTAIDASHPDVQLTLIVGADTASTLPSWREPARLLELGALAVAARPGSSRGDVLASLAGLGKEGPTTRSHPGGISFLEMPEIEISSSQVRRRVRAGEPIEDLVGAPVARYIEANRLYRAANVEHATSEAAS
jgi:nicotinate-nucleotide adenylyltransferase